MLNKKDADRYDAKQGMQSSKIKLSVPRHYFTPCLISAKCAKSLPPLLSIVSTLLQAAYDNETEWLFKGKAQNYNLQDAVFRNVTFHGEVEAENEKVYQRGQVNQQLQVLLNRNHIHIPEGTELTFTITPIDYQVRVSGTDDQDLIKQIEQVLQSGDNSKELFLHIMKSQSSDSAQFSEEAYKKYQAAREMYEVTGYH